MTTATLETTATTANNLDWTQLDATVRQTLRIPSLQSPISLLADKGDSVDDLAQIALMKLFEHLPQYDANKSSINTYAANHARQAVTDRLRYWSQPKRLLETAPLSLQHENVTMPAGFDDYFSDMAVERAVDTVSRELGGEMRTSIRIAAHAGSNTDGSSAGNRSIADARKPIGKAYV